jgi:molecular chaperone GrpE (heat shock protein)
MPGPSPRSATLPAASRPSSGKEVRNDRGEGAPSPRKPPRKKLREELLRLAADFDNYRKEVARERELWRERTLDEVVLIFLPIYEALERAAADEDSESLRQGLLAVLGLFQATLEQIGLLAHFLFGPGFRSPLPRGRFGRTLS